MALLMKKRVAKQMSADKKIVELILRLQHLLPKQKMVVQSFGPMFSELTLLGIHRSMGKTLGMKQWMRQWI